MPKITKIGAIMRPNGQLKYGPMEKYNSNYGWIESRILGRTLPQTLMTTRYKHTASHCKTKMHSHAGNVFETQIKNMFR